MNIDSRPSPKDGTPVWRAEMIVDTRSILGEGPLWDVDESVLWWIDTKNHLVHRYSPADGSNVSYDVGDQVGAVVLRERGGLLLALRSGFAGFDPQKGEVEIIVDPESHLPENRLNDGKVDPRGRFWGGSMEDAEVNMDRGALYCLHTDRHFEKILGGVGVSNGIVWSTDAKTMYYVDSPTRRVDVFDYDDESGTVANRRVAFRIPDGMGFPDGMAIDVEDKLWVALWGAHCVGRFAPETGELLGVVEVPTSHVSACAFGGPNLDELFVTTARVHMADEQLQEEPHAGSLFHAHVGVRGRTFPAYAG